MCVCLFFFLLFLCYLGLLSRSRDLKKRKRALPLTFCKDMCLSGGGGGGGGGGGESPYPRGIIKLKFGLFVSFCFFNV